jgi:hypothetical protein
LQRIAESTGRDSGFDEASRDHIRNLDVYVTRLLEEAINGRQQLANELRSEIKLLARTIAAAMASDRSPAGETPPPPTPSAATGLAATPPPQADPPPEQVGPRITVRAPTLPRRDDDGS